MSLLTIVGAGPGMGLAIARLYGQNVHPPQPTQAKAKQTVPLLRLGNSGSIHTLRFRIAFG